MILNSNREGIFLPHSFNVFKIYLILLMYNNIMTHIATARKTSASALVNTLVKLGVDSIFGYPGASVLSIYNELSKVKAIKHYLVRHEQAAVHAAEGYARTSGKTGVVLVTSGPGFTNTITGIANAYADSTPLVILAGDVTHSTKAGKVFQSVDIKALSKSCTKKCFILSENDDISSVMEEAFYTANSGAKGPVVVGLPRNLLEKDYISGGGHGYAGASEVLNPDDTEKLASLIHNAERPLVLVGSGCVDASEEVEKFVSEIQAPVVSTLMGIGNYPSENNLYLGMIGVNGTLPANSAVNEADLIIALGVSFSNRSTCRDKDFACGAKIVSINIQPVKYKCELQITADIKEFLKQFLHHAGKFKSNEKWLVDADALKDEFVLPEYTSECLHSSYVLETVSEYTKYYEPIVVTDVGQHQMLTAQFFNFNKPRKFITSGGLGTMGFGLPAAIGAHISNPKNLVLNITGDGSFQMNLQELATCREHNIPIKIIIMNNGYLGMVRQLQEKIYNTRYQVEMINPDFTKIAEAYDLFAVRVKSKDELIPALEKAINHNGTAIIDVVIDSFENI